MNMHRAIRVTLVVFVFHATFQYATAQISISGLPEMRVVEVWQDQGQLFLKSDDGRLYSVPLDTLEAQGLEDLAVDEINQGLTRTSNSVPPVADILDLLRAGISEETIKTYVRGKRGRYDLSKEDLLELKGAGASDTFLQFLIRAGGKRRFFPAYSGPPRDRRYDVPPPQSAQSSYSDPAPEGIPYYPYVYPGYYPYGGGYPYGALRIFTKRHHRGKGHIKTHHRGKGHHSFRGARWGARNHAVQTRSANRAHGRGMHRSRSLVVSRPPVFRGSSPARSRPSLSRGIVGKPR
jgi:hypothetical protein